MANINDLAVELTPYCPEMPRRTAARFLLKAAREFFETTKCWKDPGVIRWMPDRASYKVPVPSCTAAVKVLSLSFKGIEFEKSQSGLGYCYHQAVPGRIEISGPTEETDLEILTAIAPIDVGASIPCSLINRVEDALINGALSRIFKMPNKPWSSGQWQVYEADFQRALSEFTVLGETGFEEQDQYVSYLRFGG